MKIYLRVLKILHQLKQIAFLILWGNVLHIYISNHNYSHNNCISDKMYAEKETINRLYY